MMPWWGWLVAVVYAAGFHAGMLIAADAPFWQIRVACAVIWPYWALVRVWMAVLALARRNWCEGEEASDAPQSG